MVTGDDKGRHRNHPARAGMGTAGGNPAAVRIRVRQAGGHGRVKAGLCGQWCGGSEDIESIPMHLRGLRRRCKAG